LGLNANGFPFGFGAGLAERATVRWGLPGKLGHDLLALAFGPRS